MKTPGITVAPDAHGRRARGERGLLRPGEGARLQPGLRGGKGWTVAKYLLGHERLNTARIGTSRRELGELKELAAAQRKDGRPLMEDPRFRDKVSRVEIELMALEITNLRFLDQMRGGRPPGAEVSMLKIRGTEIQQALTELMMQALGPLAQPFKPLAPDADFDEIAAGSLRATATSARPRSTRARTRSSATSSRR
jgi:alkylation response protein AidB-like acyl-CoA dehydrogenase